MYGLSKKLITFGFPVRSELKTLSRVRSRPNRNPVIVKTKTRKSTQRDHMRSSPTGHMLIPKMCIKKLEK